MQVIDNRDGEAAGANRALEKLGRDYPEYPAQAPPCLPTAPTRRLMRLGSELAGAATVAQAAVNAHNTAREAYERAFVEACEDHGILIPTGPHDVNIDWTTGAVTFTPKQ